MLAAAFACLTLTCCHEDPEPDPTPSYSFESGSYDSETSNNDEKKRIEKIVKENVHVTATYSHYMWTFRITSTLKSKLPGKKIQYGIGHHKAVDGEEYWASIDDEAYYYDIVKNGDKETITFKNPFWWYYLWCEKNMYTFSSIDNDYRCYLALMDKGSSEWAREERDLYEYLIDNLNQSEWEVRGDYFPSIEVWCDNQRYVIGSYKIP